MSVLTVMANNYLKANVQWMRGHQTHTFIELFDTLTHT